MNMRKQTKLQIHTWPDEVLREECVKVGEFTTELRLLANNMLDTMYQLGGVGLAAPQVGALIRMFVIDTKYKVEDNTYVRDADPYVFINPYFRERHDSFINKEGCLSFPGLFAEVERSSVIKMVYWDLEGNKKELELYGDDVKLEIVCIQHEMDHLDGKLFIDYLKRPERRRIEKIMKKLNKKAK